ncbi:hypothetical protein SB758_03870 [Burkholderia sp. SIMBA_013]
MPFDHVDGMKNESGICEKRAMNHRAEDGFGEAHSGAATRVNRMEAGKKDR